MIRVALDGTGDFFTIQEAVDSISDSKRDYMKKNW